jgi:transposase
LVKSSYVPEKSVRDLRDLTRLRVKLIQTRTTFKNRCHKVLSRVNIRLGSKLSDVFGRARSEILEVLMAGRSGRRLSRRPSKQRLTNKAEEIKSAVKGSLGIWRVHFEGMRGHGGSTG